MTSRPGEQTRHNRVYKARGPASAQQCISCPKPARDWATIHGRDGTDPLADYQPMCRGCHLIYDGNSRGPHMVSAEGLARLRAGAQLRYGTGQCSGCGIPRSSISYTSGCNTCTNRKADRKRQPRVRS